MTVPIKPILNNIASVTGGKSENVANSNAFGELVKNAITQTANAQKAAEATSTAVASGQDIPMQDVIEAVGKAELTLQTMLTVRDRAVEAYQEIIRMPI